MGLRAEATAEEFAAHAYAILVAEEGNRKQGQPTWGHDRDCAKNDMMTIHDDDTRWRYTMTIRDNDTRRCLNSILYTQTTERQVVSDSLLQW